MSCRGQNNYTDIFLPVRSEVVNADLFTDLASYAFSRLVNYIYLERPRGCDRLIRESKERNIRTPLVSVRNGGCERKVVLKARVQGSLFKDMFCGK